MADSPPEVEDEIMRKPKGVDPMAEKERSSLEETAKKAIGFILPFLLWFLIFVLLLFIISPLFIWGWHILAIEKWRWLSADEVGFLQQILLEFKEVVLGSTVTASLMTLTMRRKR